MPNNKKKKAAHAAFFLQKIVTFDILEIPISGNLQLVAGGFIANDNAMTMHLECRNSPHVIDGTFDSGLQGTALTVTIDQDHNLTGCHDGTHANGQCSLGDLIDIVIEE